MVDERIRQFVSEAVRIKVREFDQDLAIRLRDVDTQCVKAGQFVSSSRIASYAHVCRQELRNRAQYVFIEIQRALALYPQPIDDGERSDLVGLLVTEVRAQATALQRMLGQRLGNQPELLGPHLGAAYGQLNDECEHLNDKYNLEIGAFQAASQAAARRVPSDGTVVIHGSVGILQTGASSSATLTINVGPEDREAMLKALNLAADTIRDSMQLAEEQRRQMLEVIQQAQVVAQQPRPNSTMLHGLFMVLCQTIQTLGSSAPALAALRAAALPFGIVL